MTAPEPAGTGDPMGDRGRVTAPGPLSRHLSEEAARAYVASGGARCPYCGDDGISGGPVEIDGGCAWQEVDCPACGATWHDVYTLAAVDVLDDRGRVVATLGTGPDPEPQGPDAVGDA
jgi:hypothetical protein